MRIEDNPLSLLEITELIQNVGLIVVAMVGIGIAVWRAHALDRQSKAQQESVAHSRREHVATLFDQAVRQLDSDKMHVRLGAVFTLRETVEAFPELSRPTIDFLGAYLEMSKSSENDDGETHARDIQEIMNILGHVGVS